MGRAHTQTHQRTIRAENVISQERMSKRGSPKAPARDGPSSIPLSPHTQTQGYSRAGPLLRSHLETYVQKG